MSVDVFIDTNVLLDVLAKRLHHYGASAAVWTMCEKGAIRGHISVISFNNVYYIVRKLVDKRAAERAMTAIRDVFIPAPLDGLLLNQAVGAGFKDFEDAIQYHGALRANAGYLLTCNVGHFPKGTLPVVTPEEFLAALPTK